MSSSASLNQIEKLDDQNYDSWAIQMRSILIFLDLWSYVNGLKIKTEQMTVEEKSSWDCKDGKALAAIILNIKPSLVNHVKHCKTSKSAWDKLREIFQPRGPARKIALFRQLLHIKLGESESMPDFVNRFSSVVEKLCEIDFEIKDELLVIILLSSLPKSMENFVVAMESRDELPTMNNLKVKLLEEGDRRMEKGNSQSGEEITDQQQAFLARVKQKPKHTSKTSGKCYNCGKRGHFAANCKEQKRSYHGNKQVASFSMLSASQNNILDSTSWCIDSGATAHICCDKSLFSDMQKCSEKIRLAGNNCITAIGVGTVILYTEWSELRLRNVLCVPDLNANFLSVSRAAESGLSIEFIGGVAKIKRMNQNILIAKMRENLFIYNYSLPGKLYLSNISANNFQRWHERFGHLNAASLQKVLTRNMVNGLNLDSVPPEYKCKTCMKGKISVKPFPRESFSRTKDVLELVHTDVCGPMRKTSLGGARYFVTFIDDKSRKIFVYFIKAKGQVFDVFKTFKHSVERETGKYIKAIRSDNGTEYVSNDFSKYLEENGIKRQLSVSYTPQQNGVAERANRTIVEMARCMLIQSGLDESLWAEAVNSAVYIRNRCPTKILPDSTPEEAWSGRKPSVAHLRTFGCTGIVLNKSKRLSKFQPKGEELVMVGYSSTSKAYRFFDKTTRRVVEHRDVCFFEDEKKSSIDLNKTENTSYEIELKEDEGENEDEEQTQIEVEQQEKERGEHVSNTGTGQQEQGESKIVNQQQGPSSETGNDGEKELTPRILPGRPKIIRTGKRGRPKKEFNVLNLLGIEEKCENPQTLEEALSLPESAKWEAAIHDEYKSLVSNNTWKLVELPKGEKPIGCKWVFTVKRDKNGKVIKHKARLVAKGCAQKFGINYSETFSPVVRYSTIRVLLAIAVEKKLILHQVDVSSAYLNGDLQESVYMEQPEGFIDREHPDKVLKLNKALYGLKQAGRVWNHKLGHVLKEIGFHQCNSEACVYIRRSQNDLNIIAVYVDDLIIAGSNEESIHEIKCRIGKAFKIVDNGELHHFLGFEINREGKTGPISISQKQLIMNILRETNMINCKTNKTPLNAGQQFKCDGQCKRSNKELYQSVVGSLMYLAISTRPDILHSICKLARFNSDPHEEHMAGVKHILRYLNNTIDFSLRYIQTGKQLEGFVDADWGGDAVDRKSYTGYAFTLAGAAVSWESKKQTAVALSSTEAEYMALSASAKEAVYLKRLMKELSADGFVENVTVYGDNLGAQQLVKNPVHHSRSKHIDIKYHHIREVCKSGEIEICYIPTTDMAADIFTKNLQKTKHMKFCNLLGLV